MNKIYIIYLSLPKMVQKMEKHIILLHGALGSKDQLSALEKLLQETFQVHSFNFMGHGGVSIPDNMVMPGFVLQLENYIEMHIPKEAQLTIFGYSMGGYAALLLATRNICRIDKIVTLGTKVHWNEEEAAKEIGLLNPVIIEEKLPEFAKELKQRHEPQDWHLLLRQTAAMMVDLGANKYLNDATLASIRVPCKLMIGDKDRMVTMDETKEAARLIKNGIFVVLPNTMHPIERVDGLLLKVELENA